VDLAAVMIDLQQAEMMLMDEIQLMNYFRKDIIVDVFGKHDLKWLLKDSPKVKLQHEILL
jgi:hypothetical protein